MTNRVNPDQIIAAVCSGSDATEMIAAIGRNLEGARIMSAVRDRETPRLFDWLIDMFSYQGVADAAAATYIARHGNVTHAAIATALAGHACPCPKLAGFAAYRDCRYRKSHRSCAKPRLTSTCPVPSHDLRKGDLNQLAYSLFFFLRDVCDGDLVGFIDRTLTAADRPGHPDRIEMMRLALLAPFKRIYGVADKVLSMTLANLLLEADPERTRWVEVGASMIAIDRLVHNFLHRTGILGRAGATHSFGPACYRDGGCAAVIDRAARRVDARQFDQAFPTYFPRFIQYCLWAFCAQQGRDICNGNRIDDTARCRQTTCPIYPICGRIALKPPRPNAVKAARSRPRSRPLARPPPP